MCRLGSVILAVYNLPCRLLIGDPVEYRQQPTTIEEEVCLCCHSIGVVYSELLPSLCSVLRLDKMRVVLTAQSPRYEKRHSYCEVIEYSADSFQHLDDETQEVVSNQRRFSL